MKIIIGLLLVTLSLFSQISIKSAWQNVLEHNDGLKASDADILHSRLKKESAKSMYLPEISLNASYTRLNEPIGMDISDVSSKVNPFLASIGAKTIPSEIDFLGQDITLADLQVLYPLYTGGKIDAAQDVYASQVDEAQAKHHMAKDKAFLQLIKFYYGVVMTQSLHQTRLESQKALKIHYDYAQKLMAQGQISRAELLNAQVKLDMAKIESTKAKHQMDIVKSALHTMIKSNKNPKSALFVLSKIGSQKHYANKSVAYNATMDVLDAKSKQATALVDIEKSAWHPQVVGFANKNLYKGDSILEEMAPEWAVGVGVKFELFGRKDRNKEIEAAKVLQAKVASLKAQAKEDLRLAVQKTYNELLLYRDEFDSLSSSIALAKENCKLRSLAFKEGLATSVDVVEAQTFLSGAKTQRLNAAYHYVKTMAMLCVLSGDSELFFEFEKSSKRIK